MKCNKCKKEINNLLILNNGSLVCPICKEKVIDDEIQFQITRENNELYVQSEILYLKGLKGTNQLTQYKKAVYLCSVSASLGNPKAIYRMGYYYENDFVESGRSIDFNVKVAYEYFSALVFNKERTVEIEDDITKIDLPRLKYQAAKEMLLMLSKYRNISNEEKYTVKYNFEKLKVKFPSLVAPENNSYAMNKVKYSDRVLYSINSLVKERSKPLFGIYKVDAVTLKEILTKEIDEEVLFTKIVRSKCFNISYLRDYTEEEKFIPIQSEKDIDRCLEDIEDDMKNKNFALRFFNLKPNFNVIEENKIPQIEKEFLNDKLSGELLSSSNDIEYLFYEDDILYKKKKDNNYKTIISNIFNDYCE